MATPRPFNAPTTWKEPSVGEVNRQVQRAAQQTAKTKGTPMWQRALDVARSRIRIPSVGAIVKPTVAAFKGLAAPVTAIAAGAVVGEAYKNTDRVPAVSARGGGRATFNPPPADRGVRTPGGMTPPKSGTLDDPIAGKGPDSNQVGSDADPNTPGLQGDGAIGSVRVTDDGVVQTGMTLGFRPPTRDQLIDYMGGDYKNPFASNDLEVNASDPGTIEMIDGVKLDKPMSINEYNEANPNDNPEPNQYDRSEANKAFLEADTGMAGKKAQEGQLGLVYASGQYWARNPNAGVDGEPELLAIDGSQPGGESRDAIRQYKAGEISADEFFQDYVTKTKDELDTADIDIDTEKEEDLAVI